MDDNFFKFRDDEYNFIEEFDKIVANLKRKIIICGCFGFAMGLLTGLGTFIWRS